MLYTSDGRDVEMSVASTKAFYAQVAAGVLLACAITEAAGVGTDQRRHELLDVAARRCPTRCAPCSPGATSIADAARRFAPTKRYWAVVGNGANKVAAEEVRIKLSELCYKSIACDVTEDKKHIDLSSEPLILVCAAGLAGSTADDVGKEVAIFRAHKATPIVIADDGDARYPAAAVISVPPVDPGARVRAVGDGRAPLRLRGGARHRRLGAARSARRARSSSAPSATRRRPTPCSPRVRGEIAPPRRAVRRRAAQPTATTATSRRAPPCASPGCCATCTSDRPVEEYQAESGKVGSPAALVDDLVVALTRAIEELTRPGRRHQAPGQDGHRRHLAQRRGRARPPARAGGARRRRRARRAQLPHAQGARRPRPGRGRGHRVHPLRHRRRRRSRSSTAAGSPAS